MFVYLLSHQKQIGLGLLLIFCVTTWQIPQQALNEYMALISHDQISVVSGETGAPCQMFVRPTKNGLHSSTRMCQWAENNKGSYVRTNDSDH